MLLFMLSNMTVSTPFLLQMIDRYESLEHELKLLQDTMSDTEAKLYESRTEVVELNR